MTRPRRTGTAGPTHGPAARSLVQRAVTRFGHATHGRHGDDGFTLVEVIVSLTIFAMVAAAGTLALVTGIKGTNDTTDRVNAAQIAHEQTDRARVQPLASLTASPTGPARAVRGGKVYSVSRDVSYVPAGPTACPSPTGTEVRKIVVTVRVAIPGSDRVVREDSVIAC